MSRSSTADAAVDLAAELVRIDSVNPGLVDGAAGETEIVERLADRLTRGGFAVEIVQGAGRDGRPSLIATHAGTGGGRRLLLNGHLDTVGVEGMAEPFGARIVGDRHTGRLYGRGACDMKAGVAAMIAAAETAAGQGTAGDIVLALVADEEHASCGTEAVLDRLSNRLPDACLIGEPTWLDLVSAHRGYAVIEVTFEGVAAHSAQPELGVNAVTHLGRLLAAVEARNTEIAASAGHPLAGVGSLTATVVAGGTSPFLIPDSASVVLERRTVPAERTSDSLAEIEGLLHQLQLEDESIRATPSVSVSLSREAWQFDPEDPAGAALAQSLTNALQPRLQRTPEPVAMPYWMESALWQAAGVPTVVCGPAGGGLHAAQEWVELAQVRHYADSLVEVIGEFCGPAS